MWIMLKDAFLSIVKKDCMPGDLLVRARRRGDIEKVFGTTAFLVRHTPDSDYPFRVVATVEHVMNVLATAAEEIDYPNFKDSVDDAVLHDAYLRVWGDMLAVMEPRGTSAPTVRPRPRARPAPNLKPRRW